MSVCLCLYVQPVSSSEDCVQSSVNIGSVVCLYTPVSPCVSEMEGMYVNAGRGGGHIFLRMCSPRIYWYAGWSYFSRFRSLLLSPLSVERYQSPLFVDSKSENIIIITVN